MKREKSTASLILDCVLALGLVLNVARAAAFSFSGEIDKSINAHLSALLLLGLIWFSLWWEKVR